MSSEQPDLTLAGFEISPEYIEENKKLDLVKPRQKFAPYTKAQRRKRRQEVFRFHFEQGIPAVRIAELLKVDRNTINNDIKLLYENMADDIAGDEFNGYFTKQMVRLETQRTRLMSYLSEAIDLDKKLAVEHQVSDLDFKLASMVEKFKHNTFAFWDEVAKHINKAAEEEKLEKRFTSVYERQRISQKARKLLDKIREEER